MLTLRAGLLTLTSASVCFLKLGLTGYPGGYCGSPGTVGTADGYCRVLWVLWVLHLLK